MHYELCIKPSASLLFYYWTHTLNVDTEEVVHEEIVAIEVEAERTGVAVVLVRRGTPIATAASSVFERRPVTEARSR